jgi:ATP-dependent Clp protease ATP-binding subunit ClpX
MVAGAGVFICNECVALCNDILARQGPKRDQPPIPYWQSMSDDEMLSHLPRIAAIATQVEGDVRVWVQRLRDRGITWARIGASLGMTRQSAWERFSSDG